MLFLLEIKKIVKSIPYWIFVAAIVTALFSQGVFRFHDDLLQEPQPGGSYGFKQEEIPEMIMPAALSGLWMEFCENNYTTYPIGFVKHVRLSEDDQGKVAAILSEITGEQKDAILGKSGSEKLNPAVRDGMDYSRFKERMALVDDLLGGGSNYASDALVGYGTVPLTYEEAKERYELAISSDRVTGGYARLFSDYAGVMVLSILPVFLAVILCMKDRRAKMEALIYTKKISAAKLTLIRFLALVIAAMIPVFILSYVSNMMVWGASKGMQLDYLAPLKYDLGWLLPSVMISTAVGMFLTELTGSPAAVAVQGLWWMFDVNLGIKTVSSGYSLFRLSPRHNAGVESWFRTEDYLDHFQDLLQNRFLIVGISLVLVFLTILIYEAKRRGKFGGNNRNRKKKSKA
ncbi:MAG: ABC transporter permease [Eubacterium sp.]|nr:ABC transporter permease [Eubacterium sp.]